MDITKAQLQKQFERAKALGWLPFFDEAANTVTKGYFDAADLMGIASRESNLDPVWLTKSGDGGHGFGLMQADLRSFPDFIKSEKWKDARESILMGARVLMQKWNDAVQNEGKRLTVTSSKNQKRYSFICPTVYPKQKTVIASYNCGRWALYAAAKGEDIDKYTTGGDYSTDVMSRAAQFRKLLNPAVTNNDNNPNNPQSGPDITANPAPVPVVIADMANVQVPIVPKDDPVQVKSEKPDLFVKIGAIFTFLTGVGVNFGALIQAKLMETKPLYVAFVIGGVGLIALAVWWYRKEAKGAQNRTLTLIDKAADPTQNTVELKK